MLRPILNNTLFKTSASHVWSGREWHGRSTDRPKVETFGGLDWQDFHVLENGHIGHYMSLIFHVMVHVSNM